MPGLFSKGKKPGFKVQHFSLAMVFLAVLYTENTRMPWFEIKTIRIETLIFFLLL